MKDMKKMVREGYEKGDYAGVFRASCEPTQFEKKRLEEFVNRMASKSRILDLGCGTGMPYDRYLVDRGYNLTGIDGASNHVEAARKNLPGAEILHEDFTGIDFAPGSFKGVVAFYSIFHIPREEQEALFLRVGKWLEFGGSFLVTLGTGEGDPVDDDWCGAPMAWSSHSQETYRIIFQRCGFQLLCEHYEGSLGDEEYHWWVLLVKRGNHIEE